MNKFQERAAKLSPDTNEGKLGRHALDELERLASGITVVKRRLDDIDVQRNELSRHLKTLQNKEASLELYLASLEGGNPYGRILGRIDDLATEMTEPPVEEQA